MTLARTMEDIEPARLMLVCWRAEVDVCGILDWSVSRNASPSAAGMETDLQPELQRAAGYLDLENCTPGTMRREVKRWVTDR